MACLILCVFFSANLYAFNKITVMALFNNKAMIKVDGKNHLLKAGETSPEGIKLVSATSHEAVLEYNGKQKTYQLGTEIGNDFSPPAPGATVTIAPDPGGMYVVNGVINGFQVKFVVDTGATFVSMNRNDAKRMGIDFRMTGKKSISETASGHVDVYLVTLDSVSVGDITLQDVQAAVHDADFPTVILLGNSFLGRVNMTREDRLLELTQQNR